MMKTLDDYTYFKDLNHVFVDASEKLCERLTVLSGRPQVLVGQTDYDLFPEAFADRYYRLEKLIFAGQEMATETQESFARDDGQNWIENRKYLVRGDHGEPIGLIGVTRNISARLKAEEALRLSEETLRESQRIAGIGTYALDIASGLWTSSDVLDTLFGISKLYQHDISGWTGLIHPEDRAQMATYFANEVVGKKQPFDRKYRIVRQSDGAARWMHGLGRLGLDEEGRPVTMRGTIQDITESQATEETLRESKELLQLLIQNAPASLAMFDREMRYLAVSRRWLEDYSLTDRQIIGQSHYEVFPSMPERWKESHRRALAGEATRNEVDRFEKAFGKVLWLRWEARPWFSGDGTIGGVAIFSEDITERKQSEQRLRLAASVFTHANEGIAIVKPDETVLEVNDAFTRITGYTREEMIGRNSRILRSGRHGDEFYDEMWRTLSGIGRWSGEMWLRTSDGRTIASFMRIGAVLDGSGKPTRYVALFSDITAMKEHERRLELVAHYDLLTGLPNRVLFADRVQQAMAQAHRLGQKAAVAYFDLDGFGAVNDRHGRDIGDQLLKIVAGRMKNASREGDTLARLGGDEFAAVLIEAPESRSGIFVATDLMTAAAEPVMIGDLRLQVSASAGVTHFPQTEETSPDQLLRQANLAMYQAKLAGKGRVHLFDPSQDRNLRGHHEDLEQIRAALAAGEFVLYFQPKVNMAEGCVIGAEALARWKHPRRGVLPPSAFLPVIEDHPLAIDFGEWVIESALTQLERWQEIGLDIPLSVNIGALQLQQPDFADRLRAQLGQHPGIDPRKLELEVLETSALNDLAQVSQTLSTCRALGVSLALDDFGTGYSSLTYLKQLPTNVLKIDQSFVRDMLDDPEDLAIIEGMLGLAAGLRRQVIAEGVETVEHGLLLVHLGCVLAQGYAIARPMPAEAFAAWAARWVPEPEWTSALTASPGERGMLYAGVEHRAWVQAFDSYVRGLRPAPPAMDPQRCRFGEWLDPQLRAGQEELTEVRRIDTLHRKSHALAAEIVDRMNSGEFAEAEAGLPKLYEVRDAMLMELGALLVKSQARRPASQGLIL